MPTPAPISLTPITRVRRRRFSDIGRTLLAALAFVGIVTAAHAQPSAANPHAPTVTIAPGEWQVLNTARRVRPIAPQSPQVEIVNVNAVFSAASVRTEMTVTVRNPGARPAEAQLIIPVPTDAAITSFNLAALDGSAEGLTGELLPRDEARRIYTEIVRRMIDPGLLEFAGTGLIRSSVFPVPAGGTQNFRVVYEQPTTSESGTIDYVLPRTETLGELGAAWSFTASIPAAAGVRTVYSPTHGVNLAPRPDGGHAITITDPNTTGPIRLSLIRTASPRETTITAFATPDLKTPGEGYVMLLITAPNEPHPNAPKRQVTIVIDRSGSMADGKLDQARAAAIQIIAGLDEGERFNIIDYAQNVASWKPTPQAKTSESAADATAYLKTLKPQGGTNIHDALVEAVRAPAADGFLPLVLFLTDGLPTIGVRDEVAIRDAVKAHNTAEHRVFTFGVGYDVNAPLLSGLARSTRAADTIVRPKDDVEVVVGRVFNKLAGPVMTKPALRVSSMGYMPESTPMLLDAMPAELPDLFAGDQIAVVARYRAAQPFGVSFAESYVTPDSFAEIAPDKASMTNAYVARLWAQRRIASLIETIRQNGADGSGPDKELVDEIVRLSTEYGILTEYTAFLAREDTNFDAPEFTRLRTTEALEHRVVGSRTGAGGAVQSENLDSLDFGGNFDDAARTAAPAAPQRIYQNSYAEADEASGRIETRQITLVQQLGNDALYQRGPRWVEARALPRETEEPDEIVAFGTDRYDEIASQLIDEGRHALMAQRGEVLITLDDQLVLIQNPV